MFSRAPSAHSQSTTRTTLHVDNLHCQSCVTSIAEIVARVSPSSTQENLSGAVPVISDVDISLPHRTVSFTHPSDFDLKVVLKHLDASGFDAWLQSNTIATSAPGPSKWRSFLPSFKRRTTWSARRAASHREICEACRASESTIKQEDGTSSSAEKSILRESRFALEGMTCSSCTSTISSMLSPSAEPGVHSSEVTLLPPAALIIHDPSILPTDNIQRIIEDAGYGAELITSKPLATAEDSNSHNAPMTYKAVFSISGMACASCAASVTRAMENIPHATGVSIDLLGKMGSVIVRNKDDAERIKDEIEDIGFECSLVNVFEHDDAKGVSEAHVRTLTIEIGGMYCGECVNKVNNALAGFCASNGLTLDPITLDHPTSTISYVPNPPGFTLRSIRDEFESLGYTLSIVRVDSVEERAARAHIREQRNLLLRFVTTLLFAIPTFVIAVVGMSLVGANNAFRKYLEMPVWGNASRGTVVLFALATPIQFGVGWFFYKHAWKGLKGVWRKRNAKASAWRVWNERLFRWGSMDSLVSLGTSAGYFASLSLMILDIRTKPMQGMMGGGMGWFDSSIFLMLFILAGRYLESMSRQRTGDAIATLSATKPTTGLLYTPAASSTTTEKVDFLEVGDTILVPAGASPPLDAVLALSSPSTSFNEASLTGEARPVLKKPGDEVFAGTINAGPAAAVITITKEVGETMLDGIVGVVRDAMGKKAGIERIADIVTGYFVPVVVGIAGLTFGVWSLRGYLGELPSDWANDSRRGGWALFAIQFGVAVLVVACPCGIGLAAPTAQMVGIGLAAQQGILSNGGGEAFQTISSVNTVVLDKTGTLTTSKFTVSDYKMFIESSLHGIVFALLLAAEQASTHPLAVGVREWCQMQLAEASKPPTAVRLVSSNEMPGRGLVAVLVIDGSQIEVAIGNQNLMDDVVAEYQQESEKESAKLNTLAWQMAGKSVVFLSAKLGKPNSTAFGLPITSERHSILGVFGVHDPPRPEASAVVAELRRLQMDVWMISGDNPVTAQAVAQSVGIEKSHVVAGALPTDKQAWVKRLQNGEERPTDSQPKGWRSGSGRRTIVAFCGDGVNDAPAIAQADVGLAMGGGSSVAISTADFCLLSSNLLSILTVYHLARATRRKIISNFVWACLYNVSLMPLAAGAFYPLGKTTLPPVWGSAAMALSSVSVVMNSLFLRWSYSPPKVVKNWNPGNSV